MQDSVHELKKKFHAVKKSAPPIRQRFTLPPADPKAKGVALEDGKKISEYGLKEGDVLIFKDLGPQIGYSTVFFFEYLGPLLVYPLFFLFPQIFYPGMVKSEHQLVQKIALAYWSFHYIKRILETFTVHKFGHATMPIFNLFKNCSYYWGFAAFVSYFVNHPLYTAPHETQTLVAFSLALLCQVSNLYCHILLAKLRGPGEQGGYKIPRGFLFNSITCANYTMEIWGWILYSVGVQALPAAIFTLAGLYQMTLWAIQKHNRLRKLFDGKEGRQKYPRRWIILPPFI
jgi:very-long-chain enoyl-CoA reductase